MKDDVDDETSEKRKDTDGQVPPSTDTCNLRTRLQLYVYVYVYDMYMYMCARLQPYVSNAATLFMCTRTQLYTKRQFLQFHTQSARGDAAKQAAKEAGLKHWREAKPAPQHVKSAVLVVPRLASLRPCQRSRVCGFHQSCSFRHSGAE